MKPIKSKVILDNFSDKVEIDKAINFTISLDYQYAFQEKQNYALENFSNRVYCEKLSYLYDELIEKV